MKKAIKVFISLLFLINTTIVFANQQSTNVGIRQISVTFESSGAEIKGLVWYPTLEKAHMFKLGPFPLEVARNAKTKTGRYGLVVISHGSRGSHLGHRDTAIFLAKRGFIVISVLHPKNNFLDDSDGRTTENWVNRPRHISKVLDSFLDESDFKKYIDEEKMAIIGQSAGGYTALSLVGGEPDTSNIWSHCRKNRKDSGFCAGPYSADNLNADKGYVIKNTHDPRFKSAVLLAPLGVLFKDRQALSNVKVPILIYRAEKDEVLRYPFHAEAIKQNLGIQPEFVVVKNAGHYSFLAPFPENIKQRVGIIASDPDGFNRVTFHSQMNQKIYEFLSKSLKTNQLKH